MIYVVKKIDKRTYVVEHKFQRRTIGDPKRSHSEAQRHANQLNRELHHTRQREEAR